MRRDAYGRGCPFTCPFRGAAAERLPNYSEGICPTAERLCDTRLIELKIHPPAHTPDMDDIVAAFSKVMDNIDSLRELASAPDE